MYTVFLKCDDIDNTKKYFPAESYVNVDNVNHVSISIPRDHGDEYVFIRFVTADPGSSYWNVPKPATKCVDKWMSKILSVINKAKIESEISGKPIILYSSMIKESK